MPMPTPHTPRLSVYYDGSCPLCQREIAFYRQRADAQSIAWIDVSAPTMLGDGLDCRTAMARFHVRAADGRLVSGGHAFALLWQQVPGWRWLGRIGALPPFVWILELGYRSFLPLRPWLQRLVRGASTNAH